MLFQIKKKRIIYQEYQFKANKTNFYKEANTTACCGIKLQLCWLVFANYFFW